MVRTRRFGWSHLTMMMVGIVLGAILTNARPPLMRAVGGDRSSESILAAGPISVTYNKAASVQVTQDALYYLDYRATKLIATVPVYKSSASATVVNGFAERDLVDDFKLNLDAGPSPHFLMTTGSVNSGGNSVFGEGLSLLFVYETTTRQVATYKMHQFQIGNGYQHRLDLLEVKPFGKGTAAR